MKKIILTSVLAFLTIYVYSQAFLLKGKVSSKNGPLSNCIIVNKSNSTSAIKLTTVTDKKGAFKLEAQIGDEIIFNCIGYKAKTKILGNSNDLDVILERNDDQFDDVKSIGFTSSSVSIRNFWVGAKIGYNFAGNTDDDFFVGSATIALNLLDNNDTHHTFGVVGNIGNFKFNKDTSNSKNIQKIAQSINGLSVGLGYTHETSIRGKNKYLSDQYPISYFRQFIQTGYRLTTFTKVGKDKLTLNFSQSVTTAGLEFEQTGFKNGGSITASTGVSLYLFDKNIYKEIFDEEKRNLVTIDFTVILPISKNMGFFANGTFARQTSAAYILGIIFKP